MSGKFRAGDAIDVDGQKFELAKAGARKRLREQRSWARWVAVGLVLAALIAGPSAPIALFLGLTSGFMLANGWAQEEQDPDA